MNRDYLRAQEFADRAGELVDELDQDVRADEADSMRAPTFFVVGLVCGIALSALAIVGMYALAVGIFRSMRSMMQTLSV